MFPARICVNPIPIALCCKYALISLFHTIDISYVPFTAFTLETTLKHLCRHSVPTIFGIVVALSQPSISVCMIWLIQS